MIVKVSNPMIKAMKKAMPKFRFNLLELNPESYQLKVDYDLFRNESDFNINKHIFKVIEIIYPPEYYALPRYITTRDLRRTYKNSDGSYNDFINELIKECEV